MRLEHLLSGARDSEGRKDRVRGMNEEYLVLQVGYEKIIERKDEAGKPAKLTVL